MAPANDYGTRREKSPGRIVLVPYGPVEQEDLEFLMRALAKRGMTVSIGAERKVPAAAFNRARQQYRGDMLINAARDEAADRVLAVTRYDL